MTGHKNIYLFFYYVLGVVTLNAQTIHFSEDFEGASGTTPPAGWTIEVVSGDTTIDNWHFDNPMNREIGKTNSEGQFAIFDDAFVADTIADTIDLVSPAIDLQGKNKSKLYFYEYFEGGFGGVGQVYYRSSSGDAWVKIYEVTQTSSSNPDKISINLQGLGTSPTSQIKFRWIGKEAFWWIIDDVFIYDNPSKDAGAVFVTDLPSGCVVTLSTPFGITARNFGTGNLGEIVFNYQLNNDTIVSDTVKFGTVLQSDSLYTHVFDSTSQPQFVEGFNQLKMWTSNPGGTADVFPINDTINATTTLSKLQVANFPFYEDFEDSVFVVSMCGNLGASGNGRIEIVSTDVFPSCEGGNMVVMDANKSASTIDKLDLLVDLSSCVNKSLTFTYGHVSDEKDPEDALYISVDNGGSFVKIYDYEFDSIPDSSCYTVTLNLDSIADTMGFGLTATSLLRWQHAGNDSIGSADDGFYIDDIQIDLAGQQIVDAGMKNIILPDNEIYIDSSFEVTITIRNFPASNDTLVALNINFQLDSGTVITEFWAGCLAPGDEIGYTFTNELITDSVEGIFTFCVWTSVPNSLYMYELDYSNDTICMDIDVRCSPMKADFGWGNNCLGDSIQFNATAPAAISWLWDFNNGDSSSAENPIYFYGDTGVYYVTLFTYDSKGCMDSINQWVEIFEKPWANFDADTVCQGSETSFMDNSLDAIIWDWDFKDGNNSALSDPVNTYTTAGVYDVKLVVESIEGCKDDTTISVLVYDLPIANAGADTFLTSCTATLDLLASASGGLSPYQYYWSNGVNNASNPDVGAGDYLVEVEDANYCLNRDSVTVSDVSGSTLTLVVNNDTSICFGDQIVLNAVVSGGTSPYSYDWNTAETTQSINGGGGIYSVEVTDSDTCSLIDFIIVDELPLLTVDVGPGFSICNGDVDTLYADVVGGDGNYVYQWNTGATVDSIITGGGSYMVTVTDGIGCWTSDNVVLTENSAVLIELGNDTTICAEDSISLIPIVSGGDGKFDYTWNDGDTNSKKLVGEGFYELYVLDGLGCWGYDSINVYLGVQVDAGVDQGVLCGQTTDLLAVAIGGTSPYIYNWSNGVSTANNDSVLPANYSVEITDAAGCIHIDYVTVVLLGTDLSINLPLDTTVCSISNIMLDAKVSGGTTPYTYLWSNNATTSTITVSSTGTYSVEVTDSSGCTVSADVSLNEDQAININLGGGKNICDGSSYDINPIVTGGDGNYIYSWNTGETTSSITVNGAGDYTLNVTDGFGCNSVSTVSITYDPFIASFTQSTDTLDIKDSTTVNFFDQSNGATSWSWDFGNSTSSLIQDPVVSYTASGTFTITLNSSDGSCSDSVSGTIVIVNTTGINENQINSLNFEIYPNPTNGILTLKINKPNKNQISINIFNILGEKVNVPKLDQSLEDIYKIDVTDQPEGVYFLQIVSDDKNIVKKFVINKY